MATPAADMHPTYQPQKREDFRIALICAIKEEMEAVLDAFNEEFPSYGKARGDPNSYTCRRIGKHNVVLAYIPQMGSPKAAMVAASFRMSFTGIHIGLVVGICRGVPKSLKGEEILLGDIIISTTVIQIDFARQFDDKLELRDTIEDNLPQPNAEILGHLNKLKVR